MYTNSLLIPFVPQVETAVGTLSQTPPGPVDENEFIDATRLVYDGVREIRRAVLLNRGSEDPNDSDTEWDNPDIQDSEVGSQRPESTTAEMVDEYPEISGMEGERGTRLAV